MSEHPNDRTNLQYAITAARTSAAQGGVPIGAALFLDVEGDNLLLTTGYNRHLQTGHAGHHAETDAFNILELAVKGIPGSSDSSVEDEEIRKRAEHILKEKGVKPEELYQRLTLYTTMSPCPNCAKRTIELNVRRVIVGDNKTYFGNEKMLVDAGIEVLTIQTDDCVRLVNQFIDDYPDIALQKGLEKVPL
ncbi:cytosine deaminase [Actinomortierella wolfii]|nr:cytosine deaminase [Actinomortierella wolfii]